MYLIFKVETITGKVSYIYSLSTLEECIDKIKEYYKTKDDCFFLVKSINPFGNKEYFYSKETING